MQMDWKNTLSARMRTAGFSEMNTAERYRFVAEAVTESCRGAIEAARHRQNRTRHAAYLSAEYLPGRLIVNNLMNLGLYEAVRDAMAENGADIAEFDTIPDAARNAAMICTARLSALVLLTTITIPTANAVRALIGPLNLLLYPKVIIFLSFSTHVQIMHKTQK